VWLGIPTHSIVVAALALDISLGSSRFRGDPTLHRLRCPLSAMPFVCNVLSVSFVCYALPTVLFYASSGGSLTWISLLDLSSSLLSLPLFSSFFLSFFSPAALSDCFTAFQVLATVWCCVCVCVFHFPFCSPFRRSLVLVLLELLLLLLVL